MDSLMVAEDFPLLFTLGNDTGICNNNPITLTAPPGARTQLWSNGSSQNTLQINQSGSYWLQVNNVCGTWSDTITFTYINNPQVFLGNDTTICLNDTLHLDAFFPHSTYLWQDGSTEADFHATTAGKYWVVVTNLCNQESDSIWIQVAEKPQLNLPNEVLLCDGESYTTNYNQAFTQYQWSDGHTSGIRNITQRGVYILNAQNQCGTNTQTITINTDNTPKFTLGADSIWCEEWFGVEQIGPMFDNDNVGQGWIYLWNDGSIKPSTTPQAPGEYWLEAMNPCGTTSDSIQIGIKNCSCVVYVPNAFTPNNDGWNDTFELKTTCPLMSYNIKIFNRWGEMIFESSDITKSWNGIFNNEVVPNGIYSYQLAWQGMDKSRKATYTRYGTVTVLK
jgi:gliding motility-associated-like protein